MKKEHIDFIAKWTKQDGEFYSNIRHLYRKGGSDSTLEGMLELHGSVYDRVLFRGLIFDEAEIFYRIIEKLQIGNIRPLDDAPASFSKTIHIATDFAKFDDISRFSILLKVIEVKTDILDIEIFSLKKYQKEVIVQTHRTVYEVLEIQIDHNMKNAIITLKEVEDE